MDYNNEFGKENGYKDSFQYAQLRNSSKVYLNKVFSSFDMSTQHGRVDAVECYGYLEEQEVSSVKENDFQIRFLEEEISGRQDALSKIQQFSIAITHSDQNYHSLMYEMNSRGLDINTLIKDYSTYSIEDKKSVVKICRALGLQKKDILEIKRENLKYLEQERARDRERIVKSYAVEKEKYKSRTSYVLDAKIAAAIKPIQKTKKKTTLVDKLGLRNVWGNIKKKFKTDYSPEPAYAH